MKRSIKRHLKEDEFVSEMNKFWNLVRKWQKEIIIAAIALGAVALVFLGFQALKSRQVGRDSRELGRILELRSTLAKNPDNVAELERAAAKGKFARIAALGLATFWIEQGQLDKAQAALALVKDSPRDFSYYQAQDLTAQVAILKGEYDRAIAVLKKIEDEKPKDYILDAVQFHHAEALEKKGSLPEAIALYKKLQEEYAQSYYGYDASARVRKLEAAK
jgi:predicted negative regulator of RcsB-dependent stress response